MFETNRKVSAKKWKIQRLTNGNFRTEKLQYPKIKFKKNQWMGSKEEWRIIEESVTRTQITEMIQSE